MRSSVYLTTVFFLTTPNLHAMNPPSDNDSERTVKFFPGQISLYPFGEAESEMDKQRDLISVKTKRILANIGSPNLEDCKDIIVAHKKFEQARAKTKIQISFTPKYLRQLNRSLALAHYFIGRDCMKKKTLTLDEAYTHFEIASTNCKMFIEFEDDSEDCLLTIDLMKAIMADSLMNTNHQFSKPPRKRYEDALYAAQLFEEVSCYQYAYFANSNAYEFLVADPNKLTREVVFLKEKLKYLYPHLNKEDRQLGATVRRVQAHDKGPSPAPFREFRKNMRNWRTHYEEQADTFSHAAQAASESKENQNAVIYFLSAAREYIRASQYVTYSEKKDELLSKASDCLREFEMKAARLLLRVEDPSLLPSLSIRDVYTTFYKSQYCTNLNASPLVDLPLFTYTLIYAGDFEAAKVRCDILCQLETEKGELSESSKFLRMNVDALNGNFDELIAYLEEIEKKNAEKKEKNKRKKERAKAKKIEQIQAAQTKRDNPVETLEAPEVKVPIAKEHNVEEFQDMDFQDTLDVESSSSKPKEKPQPVIEKKKTKGTPKPPLQPTQGEPKEEKRELTKKVLSSNTYELCEALLSGNKKNKIFSRDTVLKLFAELNCEINEIRGKGSHAIIRYFVDKENDTIVGSFPEFEQTRKEDEPEAFINPMNVTMPIPKEWDGPIPFYLAKSLRKMLHTMGYTLETIECEKVKPPQPPKKKTVNKNKNKKKK